MAADERLSDKKGPGATKLTRYFGANSIAAALANITAAAFVAQYALYPATGLFAFSEEMTTTLAESAQSFSRRDKKEKKLYKPNILISVCFRAALAVVSDMTDAPPNPTV
jgi:hypothetical protein